MIQHNQIEFNRVAEHNIGGYGESYMNIMLQSSIRRNQKASCFSPGRF